MVTHDVDEALFLSDRVVMMTNGPEAEVGDVLEVKFPRPRERKAVMEHPDYYKLREHLIEFLEVHAHRNQTHSTPSHTRSAFCAKTRTLIAEGERRSHRVMRSPRV